MKKYFNLRLIFIISTLTISIILWSYLVFKDIRSLKIADSYIKTGDIFYKKRLYNEALKNYKKSYEYKKSKELENKIIYSLINLNKFK